MTNTSKLIALVGLASLAPFASCNDPLKVSIPDIVQPGQLGDSASLATVKAGALGDFSIAYTGDHPDGSGGTEGVSMYGGLLADEWINSETFPTRIEVDARTIQATNADVDLWFRRMHQSRNSAEKAGALAATVPTSFAYVREHSENTDRQNNGVYNGNFPDQRYAVADLEGGNGFRFRSVSDRRTTWRVFVDQAGDTLTGFDGSTTLWTQQRYGSRKTSITVATGVEARLIQAEAALQAGDTLAGGQFLAQLNDPRTNAASRGYFDPSPFDPTDPTTEPIGALSALSTA